MTDREECIQALLNSFPDSFVNDNNEFIAHQYSNQYIRLEDCETPLDIECKVLEWFSRPAHKGCPYSQEWRNVRFREFMLDGINYFLDTNFSEEDMDLIYTALGNCVDHQRTIRFIESGYNMNLIN